MPAPAPETAETLHQLQAPGIVTAPPIPPDAVRQVRVPIVTEALPLPESQYPGQET